VLKLDPARWSDRSQAIAMISVIGLYLAAVVAGSLEVGPEPLITAWLAVAFGIFGALYWRGLGIAWGDVLSWTVPLMLWMAAVLAVRPPFPWWFMGWMAGVMWFCLFALGTPFLTWWYQAVLRKPFPPALLQRGPDDPPDTE
jgi:hypothetical protein